MPFAVTVALSLLGVGLVAEGAALFIDPTAAARFWPWTLTPLTSRAVAAWLLAYGLGALQSAWERAWAPFWPLAVVYTGFGVLQLGALARWGDVVDFGGTGAWIYVGGSPCSASALADSSLPDVLREVATPVRTGAVGVVEAVLLGQVP